MSDFSQARLPSSRANAVTPAAVAHTVHPAAIRLVTLGRRGVVISAGRWSRLRLALMTGPLALSMPTSGAVVEESFRFCHLLSSLSLSRRRHRSRRRWNFWSLHRKLSAVPLLGRPIHPLENQLANA